jgi:hypothetical protein
MIPRLPPAKEPFVLTIAVNKRLRAYFEKWFQVKGLPNESPSDFVLRQLKDRALQDYLAAAMPNEVTRIQAAKQVEIDALGDDATVLSTELD